MKNTNQWFTLIELVIWMAVWSILILSLWNFLLNYYKDSVDLERDHKEFSDITLWLKSLQKIIFENAKYITYNTEIFSWQCDNLATDWVSLGSLCSSKFWFVIENAWWLEEEYKVELINCNVWNKIWKQLVYKNSNNIIPLLWSCILSDTWYPIQHKIEIINTEIKEKLFRYYIYTENWIYKQTIFIH
jgi:hypothetical protein